MRFPAGMIIAFEGLDCSFKETNCKEFANILKKEFPNGDIETESFPRYNTNTGKVIKDWLDGSLNRDYTMKYPIGIDSLYSIDRFFYWFGNKIKTECMIHKLLCGFSAFIFDRYSSSNAFYNPSKTDYIDEEDKISTYVNDLNFDHNIFGIPNPNIVVWMRMSNFESLAKLLAAKKNKDQNELDLTFLHDVWERSEDIIFNNCFEKVVLN